MRSYAEELARCEASSGWPRAECEAELASRTVNGVICDGVVIYEATGRRCIPADVVARTKAARQASPLPAKPLVTVDVAAAPSRTRVVLVVALGAAILYGLYRIV